MTDLKRKLGVLLKLRFRLDNRIAAKRRERESFAKELDALRRQSAYAGHIGTGAHGRPQATLDANA